MSEHAAGCAEGKGGGSGGGGGPNLIIQSLSPAPCTIFTEAGFHQFLYFRPIDYVL